jgi:transglutaminase-like putative cysteine protease
VVTGYQGGELNSVDGYWTVRQSDAHAWTEVWLEGRGWVRVDPTAVGGAGPRTGTLQRLRRRGRVRRRAGHRQPRAC